MRCPKCNEEIQVVGTYCPYCKADIEKEAVIELQIVGSQIEEQKRIREDLENKIRSFQDSGLFKTAEEYRKRRARLLQEITEMENGLKKTLAGMDEDFAGPDLSTMARDEGMGLKGITYCPYCGYKINGAEYCEKCGKKVN